MAGENQSPKYLAGNDRYDCVRIDDDTTINGDKRGRKKPKSTSVNSRHYITV
jgi:hypothetical protein